MLSIKGWQLVLPHFPRARSSLPNTTTKPQAPSIPFWGWQNNGPLGPSKTNGPCWAGGGGAILRPRELNTASVPLRLARRGQEGGRGPWRPLAVAPGAGPGC